MSALRGMLPMLCFLPASLAAQTETTVDLQVGIAQSLLRANGDWRGPGVTASFHIPRTHNIDAGIEAGFFDLGIQRRETRDVDPVFGTVIQQDASEQQFGWAGLVARYHLTRGSLRTLLAAGVAVYGFNQREALEERTPGGALVRQGQLEFVDLEYTPGLSVGLGLQWPVARHMMVAARLRAHGALVEGFPVVTLSAGIGYR